MRSTPHAGAHPRLRIILSAILSYLVLAGQVAPLLASLGTPATPPSHIKGRTERARRARRQQGRARSSAALRSAGHRGDEG